MSHSYSSDKPNLPGFFPVWSRPAAGLRTVDLYDVFCGVLYLLKSGCQLRNWRTCSSISG